MKPAVYVKLALLSIALIATVLLIIALNGYRATSFLNSLGLSFGGQGNGSQTGQNVEYLSYNLCRSRVHAIIFSESSRIEEEKMKWMAFTPDARELDYIAMEKWLGQYCRLHVQTLEEADSGVGSQPQVAGDFKPFLRLVYVNGQELAIERRLPDLYKAENLIFRSTELDQALKELEEISGLSAR